MFKDRKEELRRLEEELLLEDEADSPQELPEDDPENTYLDDTDDFGQETEETYYNYSNGYGAYNAYNSDVTDEDLEEYSKKVYGNTGERKNRGLLILTLILLSAILCTLAWCYLRYKGVMQ